MANTIESFSLQSGVSCDKEQAYERKDCLGKTGKKSNLYSHMKRENHHSLLAKESTELKNWLFAQLCVSVAAHQMQLFSCNAHCKVILWTKPPIYLYILIFLDVSAVFSTFDHHILLSCLQGPMG